MPSRSESSPGRDETHSSPPTLPNQGARPRWGKAPPVDSFSSEDAEVQLDDWLPALARVSAWNGWAYEDLVLQLAGLRCLVIPGALCGCQG